MQLLVDLERSSLVTLQVPLLVSESTKQVELTVPLKDRLEDAFERKLSKYEGLVSNCKQAGWRVRCIPVEVGCRGFAAYSLAIAFREMGIEGVSRRTAIRSTTDATESCYG